MLKIIGLAVVLLIGGVLIVAAVRPDAFRVQRSASIQAPPEKIFPLINDLKRFNTWNPFDKKDPNLKDVGRGSIEIIDSVPASEVRMNLNMLAPMEASNVVEFSLRPEGAATRVTWAIQGRVPFFAKACWLEGVRSVIARGQLSTPSATQNQNGRLKNLGAA